MIVHALIVAGGRGVRAGDGVPKQYRAVGGKPVLRHSLETFLAHPGIAGVQVVIHPDDRALYDAATEGLALPAPIDGGATRQASVLAGLEAVDASHVLIHDAARPFVTPGMIDRVIAALGSSGGATPALPVVDSLRTGDTHVEGEVSRDRLHRVQTPQGFALAPLLAAHRIADPAVTDDVAVAVAAGMTVALVAGDESAFKLTTADDFVRAEWMLAPLMISRTAMGYDVHRFGPGDHVWLCGVRVAHDFGLIGHSDADVGLHALTDALLGCIGAGDIGTHFPPSDERWRGASSDRFLAHACSLVAAKGGVIDHLDLTIISERPKVGPHRVAFATRIAEITGCASVSIKATTTEGLGFTGRGEGIAAQGVASIRVPA
ncbi:bifunctional 2-C-methyl-D-erythritol 4-phosphate cytidylyltransferase/2-C-methyl-D-erythritol 2,4-cyclodiphosphate synthase [Polymorphobacter sp. PAMC 29334]|uniref:bifunctional 2-C-methyl-D-erythritol 4-phosphate cytidylyltransferase/2-C-methyl-D-erythritol 2,4-cyclodiphosphate synthase n=1 Tax=Polymorphobacter sp. PAMC 29334 TaxID=2862331 RepID=UPI001C74A236|nr:bifunctional 2-C-methyl-D-erythritol 4-phosphate cytidylyltransferase/2-C-methyl-D-erythritol 2,4-cyclodiphosphate synthase [Polymorphobacter sp. PAMC 29334]QYE34220.1 bifunctional 2-C-methyl-D-erythritol 4-phosphate cytidylyltransferase/2-C-methyl-D-erythritol 2,4-cyclodiphosphate synthase [Polymorphobacter sp. PAMC 29334]